MMRSSSTWPGACTTAAKPRGPILVDLELASIDRHIAEIRDIDAALMRIAKGEYGECSDCGEPIAFERLQANPAAQRCIICQRAHDHNFAHGAQPSM